MENVILHALLSLSFPTRSPPSPVISPGEACFGPLGCFSVDPPWSGIPERPVAALPLPLNVTTPVFCFYTPARPLCHKLFLENIGSVYTSGLDRNAPLIFITHGYMETADLDWMVEMKEALLEVSPDIGVVTVDWSLAAYPPYAQAVANIRLAGAATGYLLHMLAEYYEVPLSSIHLVGHSLGAHLMGYAGDFVKKRRIQKVGRITGLDPAGPYFINTPPEVRLDPADAEFVDVIHTDIPKEMWEINKLGHPDPIGHVDYYLNGGFEQAGCIGSAHARVQEEESLSDGVASYIGCNHQRSHAVFTESILSRCQFLGVLCESWEKYLQGLCWGCESGYCSTMGFHATPLKLPTAFSPEESPLDSRWGHELDIQNKSTNHSRNNVSEEFSNEKSSKDEVTTSHIPDGAQESHIGLSTSEPHFSNGSPRSPMSVFLGTNSRFPFCAEQYRVTVSTSASLPSQQSGGDVARFTVRLRGQFKEHVIPPPEKPTFIKPGGTMSWVGFSTKLGPITALQVDYEEDQGLLHALIWRFSSPALYIDSFTVEELSTGLKTLFQYCGSKMEARESHILLPDKVCENSTQPPSETQIL